MATHEVLTKNDLGVLRYVQAAFKSEEFWVSTAKQLPDEGVVVRAMDSTGSIHELKRIGNLWFIPDGSMYVYFTPLFWQPKKD